MRTLPDSQRRSTDRPWIALLGLAILAQLCFAALAVASGSIRPGTFFHQTDSDMLELVDEVDDGLVLPIGPRIRQAWSTFHLDKDDLPALLEAVAVAVATGAAAGAVFVLMLANVPVHLVIYCVSIGGPILLVTAGGLGLAGVGRGTAIFELVGSAGGGWTLVGLGAVGLLGTYISWGHIRLGVAVLRCTSAFLQSRSWVGCSPFLFALVHLAGILIWLCAVLGAGVAIQGQDNLHWTAHVGIVTGLMLCFLWGSMCVTSLSTFAVAYIAGGWYGRGPPQDGRSGPQMLFHAVFVGLRYHLGSIAFGSLLLALVRLLNIVLFFASKAEERTSAAMQGAVPRLGGRVPARPRPPSLLRSCRNFAAEVLESAATWASKQAFVQVALSGCGFGRGAMQAARLAATSPAGFVAVETLSNVFHRACELFLVGTSVLAAALLGFEGFKGLAPPAFAAWLVAESFLHPYSVATATLLHCCLLEQQDRDVSEADRDSAPAAAKRLRKTLEDWGKERDDGNFVQNYAGMSWP
ncbi:unnamed protein product [Polarella glacialis]|uniref:Choline transporter-like protein n=1 Tax=Polarella glacialis TaxID=89957 RepID=A0A813GNE1_POLGL|nr:unnamed protein product [Polarella glacialis]